MTGLRLLLSVLRPDALAHDLEQHHGRRGRDVERLDVADQRNGQLLVTEFEHLFRDTRILGAHHDHRRTAEIGIVEQFAALLRGGHDLKALRLQCLERIADRTDAAHRNRRQRTGRRADRLGVHGRRVLQRRDQPVRPGTLGRAGDVLGLHPQ